MTAIVALADGERVWMAADSMTNVADRPVPTARKITRIRVGATGEALLGCAGDGGLMFMARHRLHVDGGELDEEDPDACAFTIAQAISELTTEHHLTNEYGQIDGQLLLGWKGRVWNLTHCQAIARDDGRASIGCGGPVAIGALDALLACGVPPCDAVAAAVDIAIARDRYCGGDVVVETL